MSPVAFAIFTFGVAISRGVVRALGIILDTKLSLLNRGSTVCKILDLPQVDSLIFLVMARYIGTIKTDWKGQKPQK